MKNSISDEEKLVDKWGRVNLIIRKFTIEDYDKLISLWTKAGLMYKPEGRDKREKIAYEIEQPNSFFIVAEHGERIIGSVFGTHDGRKGWINRLAVVPEERMQGVARKLVQEVEKHFDKIGIEINACLIEEWNSSSIQVFEKMGYTRHDDIKYLTKRKHQDV